MAHWSKDSVYCNVCCTGSGQSLMIHLGQAENRDELMWCPLCGSFAKLNPFDPISSFDFVAPYVSFDKEKCCRNGGNQAIWKKY